MSFGYPVLQVFTESPSLSNSFTTAFSLPITFVRKGDLCYVTGFVTRSSQPSNGTIICNVSAQFRPARNVLLWGQDPTGINARCDITTSGDLSFVIGAIANTSQFIGLSGVYPLF